MHGIAHKYIFTEVKEKLILKLQPSSEIMYSRFQHQRRKYRPPCCHTV